MATTYSNNSSAQIGFVAGVKDALIRLQERATNYRHYRQTMRELSGLTDRDLADMGIARSGIKRIALDAVYGPTGA